MTNIDTEIPGGNGPKPSRKGNGKGSKSKSFRKGNGKTDTSTARSTPIELTFFWDQSASRQVRESMTLDELRSYIQGTPAKSKEKLPWLKLATFGDQRSENNCLRHDANVLSITGIELDYDAKAMPLDAAIEVAKKARLLALFYTSPSYTEPEPKWRILLPTSKPLPPDERAKLVARVNGLYGGIFAPESFNLSLSYYFGRVNNNPGHRAVIVDGDYIDLRDDLEAGALYKKNGAAPDDDGVPDGHFDEFAKANRGPTQKLNDAAMANLSAWVPELFPTAKPYKPKEGAGGFRVTSADLGRDLEEDLSILPNGIKDWGVHDLGDPLEGRRTPIQLVLEWKFEVPIEEIAQHEVGDEFGQAYDWLRERLPDIDEDEAGAAAAEAEAETETEAETAAGASTSAPPPKKKQKIAWPTLAPEALHGLAGEVVAVIGPHTEADPVALLLQFLVWFGNALGRKYYYLIEGDKHHTNLFVVLVGQSSKSRKGTSAGRIRQVMLGVAPEWVKERVKGGLSSGEGLIWAVRDASTSIDKKGNEKVEPGVKDKRLLLDEREFFQSLAVMKREGNIVSVVVRDAWDGRDIGSLTKNSPAHATAPHISVCAHITQIELQHSLDHTSTANGYANRFLFACVKRSKELPHGGYLDQSGIDALCKKIRNVFSPKSYDDGPTIEERDDGTKEVVCKNAFEIFAEQNSDDQIRMDTEAHELWENVYHDLSMDLPGLFGAICGRAEAQTIRLALLYALLDGSDQIKAVHLRAALALWQYCKDSVHYIFGDSLGDPLMDAILSELRHVGELSRTKIHDLFKRNQSRDKVDAALEGLQRYGKVRSEMRSPKGGGAGRPIEVWVAV
jgi:hypothetical protein